MFSCFRYSRNHLPLNTSVPDDWSSRLTITSENMSRRFPSSHSIIPDDGVILVYSYGPLYGTPKEKPLCKFYKAVKGQLRKIPGSRRDRASNLETLSGQAVWDECTKKLQQQRTQQGPCDTDELYDDFKMFFPDEQNKRNEQNERDERNERIERYMRTENIYTRPEEREYREMSDEHFEEVVFSFSRVGC